MISLDRALHLLLEHVAPLDPIEVGLDEALGLVLAEAIESDIDIPPFNRSAMDGYAVLAADTAGAPVELDVTETVAAGEESRNRLEPGQAAKIMTGAPVPEGADAVIMVEKTAEAQGGRVRIHEPVAAGKNIAPQGQDIARGQVALPAGARVRAEEVGILATVGAARVKVIRRPRVATLVTGDELIPVSQRPTGAQIRESNGLVLAAQLARDGIRANAMGVVADDPEKLERKITAALEFSDVLILSGGVSMGDRDFVPPVLAALGAETIFHKVAVKPGKPVLFARKGECLIFGLPGNPVSALVVYELFIRPAVRVLMGWAEPFARKTTARLRGKAPRVIGRRQFLPARLALSGGELSVELVAWHGSGDMIGLREANGLVVVPEKPATVNEGDRLEVIERDF